MVTQISLAIIAIALVTLVGFLIAVVLKVNKAISLIQQDVHHLSVETSNLITRFNELTLDLTHKSQSLNFLFAPLAHLNQEGHSEDNTLPQLVDWAAKSWALIKKSKEFIKKYV